jgi:hypothetical protein
MKLDTCAGKLVNVCVATSPTLLIKVDANHTGRTHRPAHSSSANIIRPPPLAVTMAKISEEIPGTVGTSGGAAWSSAPIAEPRGWQLR